MTTHTQEQKNNVDFSFLRLHAVQIFKKLNEIKAISFDLDDTLYDNRPIIIAAVQAQNDYLKQLDLWPKTAEFWHDCRNQVIVEQPHLIDNVTMWRQCALYFGLKQIGYCDADAKHHANMAYQAFAEARSNIIVADEVLLLLKALRTRFKIIAITNGNVDVDQFNLKGHFDLVLMAGRDGKAKPHPELFDLAARHFDLSLGHILHVGDSLDTDVQGANIAGCMSAWLENQFTPYRYKGLAHLTIKEISELQQLLID